MIKSIGKGPFRTGQATHTIKIGNQNAYRIVDAGRAHWFFENGEACIPHVMEEMFVNPKEQIRGIENRSCIYGRVL